MSPTGIPHDARVVIATAERWYVEIEMLLEELGIHDHVRVDAFVADIMSDKIKLVAEKFLDDNI